MQKILEVEKLNFSLEGKRIISNISLEVESHKILGLLGESGSGKSTLLKLIAGFLNPDSGKLEVEGQPIDPPSEKLIPGHPKIKMVRQDNPLFPNISLRENIAYELRFFNKDYQNERVNKLLKLTRLDKVAEQLPRHSSEGEQQRTAIARALADEPSLLLLDEPFSNLDYKNKNRLKKEIRDIISEEEIACIFVTHDISDVFGVADELSILKKGKISQNGRPLTVYKEPKTEYEAGLTGDYTIVSKIDAKRFLGMKVKTNKILIRPENIELSPKGKVEAEVISLLNRGYINECTLQIEELKLKVFTMEDLSLGQKVNIDVKEFTELK